MYIHTAHDHASGRSAGVQAACGRRSLSALSPQARIGTFHRLATAIPPTSCWIQPQKSTRTAFASSSRSYQAAQQREQPASLSVSLLQQQRRRSSSIATRAYNNTVDLVAKESYATDKVGRSRCYREDCCWM